MSVLLVSVGFSGITKAVSPVSADIQVDADCGGSPCGTMTLASSNTTRKLAVSSNGSVYAVFYGATGIWVAKSTNRGASFASATQVSTDNKQPEIGTSADGSVYVIWNSGSSYVISKSTDGAGTWSAPVTVGTASGGQAHIAIDGDHIYAIGQSGTTLYVSNNAGATWSTTVVGSSQAFADVHVDKISHAVYVFTDNPSVYWYVSTDRGVTLSAREVTGKSVFYSVGALTSTQSSKYFYMVGSGSNLERINLSDKSVETKTVSSTSDSQGRSLAADSCGNVITGHKSGSDLYFQYSTDSGATFSSQEMVVASATRANASINTNNGDVLFLYEKDGHIFLSTYSGLLTGGTNCYAVNMSNTALEFTAPGQTPSIVLSNTSGSPVSVDAITISGTAFVVSHNCGTSIPANSSCTVLISGSTQADETLSITLGGVSKSVPVSLGAIAATRPVETTTTTTTTTVVQVTTTTQVAVIPSTTTTIKEVSAPVVAETTTTAVVSTQQQGKNKNNENKKLPNTGSESSTPALISFAIVCVGILLYKKSKQIR
jgi:LPXTG-motif cell wall-anchored protein